MNAEFAAALLDKAEPCPTGLRVWNRSDPAERFAVYRNNVVSSLVDALADNLPVVQQLVGEQFFRAMAALFVRCAPPRSPILAHYGFGVADFIADFEPARGVPYLADIARLEMACQAAYHAADTEPLTQVAIARALACNETVGALRFALHPSVRLLRSRYAIVSIRDAHQYDSVDLSGIEIHSAETALVLRDGLTVQVHRITSGAAKFIDAIRKHFTLADSAAGAQTDPDFDLTATLSLLTGHGALVEIQFPEDIKP